MQPYIWLLIVGVAAWGPTGCARGANSTTGHQPAASPSTSPSPRGADPCSYLTVDEVKQVLDYDGRIDASHYLDLGFRTCSYHDPDDSFADTFARVDVRVEADRGAFDPTASLDSSSLVILTAADCTSASVRDTSVYCPKSDQSRVIFTGKGLSVIVTVTSGSGRSHEKIDMGNDAALRLASLIASRL